MPQASLGAFGKHPGWNDHIDDLGLDTQRLTDFKRVLYVEGIAACVEGGQWEKLDEPSPGAALPEFDHVMVSRAGGTDANPGTDFIFARIWSSRDGKGRDKFPMVLCTHTMNMGFGDALRLALPALEALSSRCRQASAAAEVVAYVDTERQRLRAEVARIGAAAAPPAVSLARFLDHPDLGPSRRGIHRVIYQFERELVPFMRPNRGPSRSRDQSPASRQIRLPACGDSDSDVLAQWAAFMDTQIDPGQPLMLIHPRGRAWVDAIVGEPIGSQMFCLRASDAAMPPVSQVPYTIEPTFSQHADQLIATVLGAPSVPSSSGSGASSPGLPVAPRSARAKILVVLVLLAALAAAIFVLVGTGRLPDPRQPETATQPSSGPDVEFHSDAISSALASQRALIDRKLAADPERTEQLTAQRVRVESYLASLERSIPRGVRRPGPAPEWLVRMNEELVLARERRLQRAFAPWTTTLVDPAAAGTTDDLDREVRDLTDLYKRAARLSDEMAAAEALMNNAYGLNERSLAPRGPEAAGGGGPEAKLATVQELSVGWRNLAAVEPVVRTIVNPLLERVNALAAVEAANETEGLLEAVTSPTPSRPELAVAAWRRLGERPGVLWPGTTSDLDQAARAAAGLRPVIATIPNPDRRKQLQDDLKTVESRRLIRFLSFSSNPEDLDEAFTRLADFGVTVTELDPWLQYNYHLHALRVASEKLGDADLRRQMAEFVQSTKALRGGIAFRADVAPILVDLDMIAAGKDPQRGAAWWSNLGPAATGRYTAKLDGDRLTFAPKPEFAPLGGGASLEFVLIRPPASTGVAPFYLGATEVSVAMVATIHAVVAADPLNPAPRLSRYLQPFTPDDDPRFGPRSWEWTTSRTSIRPARDWLVHVGERHSDEYAPGTVPARPTGDSPMQQVSPASAVCLAALAGCRLPTSEQWKAAAAAFPTAPDSCNLRDQTWARHRAHVMRFIAEGRPRQLPDAGSLDSGGPNASAARPNDDGLLWFAPGSGEPSSAPRNLIGNVAEFVLDISAGEKAAPPTDPRDPAAAAFLKRHADSFGVIGGSALSDPAIDPQTLRPISLADSGEGYCDVGFRLAFSGRHLGPDAATLAARVERLLTPTPYLKGK